MAAVLYLKYIFVIDIKKVMHIKFKVKSSFSFNKYLIVIFTI